MTSRPPLIEIEASTLALVIAIALVIGALGGVWGQMWRGCP